MSNDIPYTGPRMTDSALITRDEVDSGKAAAPEGTSAYTVQPGDNLTTIATQHGYGSPPDMDAFYKDNGQYAQRSPDLIYPGEQVFVRAPENGTTATGQTDPSSNNPTYQNYKDGQPSGAPYAAEAAPNGRPANASTIDQNGNAVRTDAQGNPANGYFAVDGNNQASKYQRFENGAPVKGDTFNTSNSQDRKTDASGALLNGTVTETRDDGNGRYTAFNVTYENGIVTQRQKGGTFE